MYTHILTHTHKHTRSRARARTGERPPRRTSRNKNKPSSFVSSSSTAMTTPPSEDIDDAAAATDPARHAPLAVPRAAKGAVASIMEQSPFPSEEKGDTSEEGAYPSEDSSNVVSPASVEASSMPRPVYIAPKTKTKSLRGSVVIKADMVKKAESPSEEEKSEFPRMFLNSLSKNSIGGGKKLGG